MQSEGFVRGFLADYYNSVQVNSVPEISSREFGFGEFGKKISSRHLSFANVRELNSFLREKVPFYISYSNAIYEHPGARPMESKNMLGADLIYEFDADDLKTSCKLVHDSWKCLSCSAFGKGNIKACPECGSGTDVDEWVCGECLREVKNQTKKLLRVLQGDFGFSGFSINFSGSKGFHLHVRSESVRSLSKYARLELLDYITGTNLDLKTLGFEPSGKAFRCPPRPKAGGWGGLILNELEVMLNTGDEQKIAEFGREGLPKKNPIQAVQKLLKEKPAIISGMGRGVLPAVSGVNGPKFWPGLIAHVAMENSLGVDRQTSIDINKIIRVPDTIHGSTCMLAKTFDLARLDSFDPLRESVVMPEKEIMVANATSPKFCLGGKWFGPFNNENVLLPGYAALFLIARNSAQV